MKKLVIFLFNFKCYLITKRGVCRIYGSTRILQELDDPTRLSTQLKWSYKYQ